MAPSTTDSTGTKPPTRPTTGPVCGEVKPRLTKEQHDILENRFLKENKPSTNAKKGLAEMLNVPLEKVNVRLYIVLAPGPCLAGAFRLDREAVKTNVAPTELVPEPPSQEEAG
jgi:hypothetical protein